MEKIGRNNKKEKKKGQKGEKREVIASKSEKMKWNYERKNKL